MQKASLVCVCISSDKKWCACVEGCTRACTCMRTFIHLISSNMLTTVMFGCPQNAIKPPLTIRTFCSAAYLSQAASAVRKLLLLRCFIPLHRELVSYLAGSPFRLMEAERLRQKAVNIYVCVYCIECGVMCAPLMMRHMMTSSCVLAYLPS